MKYLMEIDYDFKNKIVKETLIEDYKLLISSIEVLRSFGAELMDFQKEDLETDLKYKEAISTVLSYYLTHEEFSKIITK
jgi:hypothetical protein